MAAPGQFELGILHRQVAEAFDAIRYIEYPANYGDLIPIVRFRTLGFSSASTLRVRGTGHVSAWIDSDVTVVHTDDDRVGHVAVPAESAVVTITVHAKPGSPAALTVLGDNERSWECSTDGSEWVPVDYRGGTDVVPPHDLREPVVVLPLKRDGDLFQLDAPILGRVVLEVAAGTPRLLTGESPDEARSERFQESFHEMEKRRDGSWASIHEVGMRFATVANAEVTSAHVEASAHPAPRRGAFACSDDRLTDIWAASAYTIRLCMQNLVLDGVKRDRLPWMGDQAMNTLANAYAFADGDIVADSLIALGQNPTGFVNGIADYSLWWVINTGFYARHFGAHEYLGAQADRIDRFLQTLAGYAGPDGVFRPKPSVGGFSTPVLIDWGANIDLTRISTALQIMWLWALRTGAHLLSSVTHPGAGHWASSADAVETSLRASAWDESRQAWRTYFDSDDTDSVYPNLLAVLAGLHSDNVPDGVRHVLKQAPRPGTPFMAGFALSALGASGEPELATARIRSWWGAMLDADARTFWEEFDAPEKRYVMYGRPYGKSLCHAWSAGPAALLPELICGIRPVTDGWKKFTVAPHLGGLSWAGAVVPVAGGEIGVIADASGVRVHVPEGHTLVAGGAEYMGPRVVELAS